jgi:hypothetical protein
MMNNTKLQFQTIGLMLMVLFFVGCGEVRTKPTATPTDISTSTPTTIPTPKPTPTHTPTPSPAQAVQVICLNVNQDLPLEPISRSISRILTGLDLQVVEVETACDATLNLDLTIQALGAFYAHEGSSGSSYCYTGSEIHGQMTLITPGDELWELPIAVYRKPASGRIFTCPKSDEVNFNAIWPEPVLAGLALLWGPQVYVQALNVFRIEEVYTTAAELLEEIGTEKVQGATPALLLFSLRWRGNVWFNYADIPEDISSLIQTLEDKEESWERRVIAARVLVSKREETATPSFIHVLEDDNLQVRIAAAWALGQIAGEVSLQDDWIPALTAALKDREPWVRETAAWSLGELWGEEGVIPALTQAIGDPNLSVRETAIRAIPPSRLHNTRIDSSVADALTLALSHALEDETLADCHYFILRDLEMLGPQAMEAVPVLITHMQGLEEKGLDPHNHRFVQIREALKEITGQYHTDATAWQEWWDHQQ